jgi:hypothetical protein
MDMTRKPRFIRYNGSIQHRRGPKKKSRTGSEKCEGDTVFLSYWGVLHHEYTPLGQTVNKESYQEVLHHLRHAVRHKRLEPWDARNWQLHHDNAPAHSSHLIQGFLANHGSLRFARLPTLLTWLLVISGCSRD